MEQIKFQRDPKKGFGVKMPGAYFVTEATLREAWTLFWRGVHKLDKSRTHSAEALACTSEWQSWPDGKLHAMGRCYKYFARNGILPITLANPEAKCNFKYRLTDGLVPPPTIQ